MPSRTARELDFFFSNTFPYEVSMMRATYLILPHIHKIQLQDDPAINGILRNCLIESFCIHARNLIDFFRNRDNQDFKPKMFAIPSYTPTKAAFLDLKVIDKLNEQIAHMSAKRTAISSEKIGHTQRQKIITAVEGEIERFRKHLTEEYRSKWKVEDARVTMPPTFGACTTSAPTTSSHFLSFSLDPPPSAGKKD